MKARLLFIAVLAASALFAGWWLGGLRLIDLPTAVLVRFIESDDPNAWEELRRREVSAKLQAQLVKRVEEIWTSAAPEDRVTMIEAVVLLSPGHAEPVLALGLRDQSASVGQTAAREVFVYGEDQCKTVASALVDDAVPVQMKATLLSHQLRQYEDPPCANAAELLVVALNDASPSNLRWLALRSMRYQVLTEAHWKGVEHLAESRDEQVANEARWLIQRFRVGPAKPGE